MVRGVYYARYYKDGRELRKSLSTNNRKEAEDCQKAFYKGKPVYTGKSVKDKLKDNPDLYIYSRPPFVFQVAGIAVACNTREEAEKERDKYLATL